MAETNPKFEATKKLMESFPEDAVERTQGRLTGKGYDTTGYKYQYVANRINTVLGVGSYRTEQQFETSEHKTQKGTPMFDVVCDMKLFLGFWKDNTWNTTAESFAIGGHTSKTLLDAKKGAYTNAFKAAWDAHISKPSRLIGKFENKITGWKPL